MTHRVIRAAAGCGKTTALATAYLQLIAEGVPVDGIIAITFTRRAAAELVERVGLALRAATGDTFARQELGAAADAYLDAAPEDPSLARQALADLGSAPIGTTDHFVNVLLAEFALDAALTLPDGSLLPLDVGLVALPDLTTHLDAAARRLLDPPEGDPPDDVQLLLRYFSLGDILQLVCTSSELDGMPSAPCAEVLRYVARQVAELLAPLDLAGLLKVEGEGLDAWRHALEKHTNAGAEWTLPAIARWLDDGAVPIDAPLELVSWSRKVSRRPSGGKALWKVFSDASIDFGITAVRLDHVLVALRHPYERREHLELADTLRGAVERLRVQVGSEALTNAALQGELPHVHMTRAAARLAGLPHLTGRFQALLVDEIQDADPDQLRLYEALAAQAGMQSVFVGDGRQSIYLFRGGEPAGLARLTEQAAAAGTVEARLTNYRSTPPLVGAHKALFAAIDHPMRRQHFEALEDLGDLEPFPGLAANVLSKDHHDEPAPVHIVRTEGKNAKVADDAALLQFHLRLQAAWSEPGHDADSAAVLCPTWAKAHAAAALLRRLAGDEHAAWVEGGDAWLRKGVGRDVAFWLRALLDPTDDIAWLAVWKHPSIGLSDGALARVRAGVGLTGRDRGISLGQLVHVEGLETPHRPDDIEAFRVAAPPLREALERLGRDDTSEVLDALVHQLRWRMLLAVSPEGDDELARLEVLLDWIGERDAEGVSVDTLTANLQAERKLDIPRVRLDRRARTITCTTIFQAKGLAWDHVAVLSPGRGGRLQVDADDVWVDLGEGQRRLTGLSFDPEGGLLPFQDPLRRLSHTVRKARFAEEGARLAYVALTRARRSVTFGLPKKTESNRLYMADAQKILQQTWPSVKHPGIAHVAPPAMPETHALPLHEVTPVHDRVPSVPAPTGKVLHELAPSAASARYARSQREAVADHIRQRVMLTGGLRTGQADLPPPKAARPSFSPADWGTLTHEWFAAWGFRKPPTDDRIRTFLIAEWGADDPEVRAWLRAVSERLQGSRGSLWELVTDPKSKLHFEVPLLGIGGPDDDLLLSGRVDLLVKRPKGMVIVDFKAGEKSPSSLEDLVERASLKTYGPQLDSYRGALERRGLRVIQTSLWFVRTGASVTW